MHSSVNSPGSLTVLIIIRFFSIIRKAGAYEEVPVDWELTSVDAVSGQVAETFNMTKGTILFPDGVRIRNIILQVRKNHQPYMQLLLVDATPDMGSL